MVRIALILLFACLLNSCFVNRALNYPFRGKEIITSFSIDPNTSEVQTFEFDEIKTEKMFFQRYPPSPRTKNLGELKEYRRGPYQVSLCIDDTLEYYGDKFSGYSKNGVKVLVTLSVDGIEQQRVINDLDAFGVPCGIYNGWQIADFGFPGDFDINEKRKFLLSFQIIEDNKKYLAGVTNPKLVFSAGSGSVK